jgi:hypothetical protein
MPGQEPGAVFSQKGIMILIKDGGELHGSYPPQINVEGIDQPVDGVK